MPRLPADMRGLLRVTPGATGAVEIMPRLPADMRISLKKRGGATYRIELIRQAGGKRFWVRRDGVRSTIVPEATATEIAERIRQWILAEEPDGHRSRRGAKKKAAGAKKKPAGAKKKRGGVKKSRAARNHLLDLLGQPLDT